MWHIDQQRPHKTVSAVARDSWRFCRAARSLSARSLSARSFTARRLQAESLEARSLLAADTFSLGEGGAISWSQALEAGTIRAVSPIHDSFTEVAKQYYSQTALFDLAPTTLVPNVPIQLGGETRNALLATWPELDYTQVAVSAWQYEYGDKVDLADNVLSFSVGVPGFYGEPTPLRDGILPVPHPSLITTVSVELIDARGNSRGWFLDSPAQGWHDYRLHLGRADSQGDFKFVEGTDFDIHSVVAVRMDEAAMRLISITADAVPPTGGELVHWGAWSHLRVDEIPQGAIHGLKFHDLNANGQRDPEEPGLGGFEIVLSGTDTQGNTIYRSTTSLFDDPQTRFDESGRYWFEQVPAGTYKVQELLVLPAIWPPAWVQSAPPSGEYVVRLSPGETVEGLDFGNFQPAVVQGFKYHDLNANGVRDWNESGLADWKIVLTGEDGHVETVTTQEDNPLTLIDEAGFYRFLNVRPGRYKVTEVQQPGWKSSEPSAGAHPVLVQSGQTSFGNNFGNYQLASVHGIKYEDVNGNGQQDRGEPGLPGVKIILGGIDGQGNSVVRTVETMRDNPFTDFDETGRYAIGDVVPGRYKVFEVVPDGWKQSEGDYGFEILSGQSEQGVDFGNYRPAAIHGRKTLDLNTPGKHEPWEPGLAGWTIVLEGEDGQGNRVRRTTETRKDDPRTDFDESGYYVFSDLAPGKYAIKEVLRPGWRQTSPDGPYEVKLASGGGADGLDFLNASPYRCDLNGDAEVDAADMAIMFANWGENSGLGNLNGDRWVDAADAGICFREWTGDRPRPIDPAPVDTTAAAIDVAFAQAGSSSNSSSATVPRRALRGFRA